MQFEQFEVRFMSKAGVLTSCDWHASRGSWQMSSRPPYKNWGTDGDLSEEGRKRLLSRFGLKSIADNLPLARLKGMLPQDLLLLRHDIEAADPSLTKHVLVNDARYQPPAAA